MVSHIRILNMIATNKQCSYFSRTEAIIYNEQIYSFFYSFVCLDQPVRLQLFAMSDACIFKL